VVALRARLADAPGRVAKPCRRPFRWVVQDAQQANLAAKAPGAKVAGVALRELQLLRGFGTPDYILIVDGKALGVLEAKKLGTPLVRVETQSARLS